MLAVAPVEQRAKFSSDAFLVFIDKMQSQFCAFIAEYKFPVFLPFVLDFIFQ